MAILVYRNILGRRELLGKIEHGPGVDARFTYDKEFLVRTQGAGDNYQIGRASCRERV